MSAPIHRLSIPGNVCSHCGAVIGKPLACPGCGWVDPLTRRPVSTTDDLNTHPETKEQHP